MLTLCAYTSVYSMEYVQKFQKLVQKRVSRSVKKAFSVPKNELEAPKTYIRTPLESGTLEYEVENVIEQINVILELHKLGPDSIVKCSVLITDDRDKNSVFEIFKRKKFNPRTIKFEITDLNHIQSKIAVEVKIFKSPKKKQDRLTSTPKKARL